MRSKFIEKYFLFNVSSFSHVKRFSLGGKPFTDDEEAETEVSNWPRKQSKDLFAAVFRPIY
jgi:hypothetical protein